MLLHRRCAAAARRPAGKLAAALAQVGEAQDRVDQVVVGGRARARRRRRRRSASRSAASRCCGRGGEALAKAAVVRVDEELLAGLGVLHHEQAEVGQVHLERIVQAHRDHLVALRELAERLAPSRAR